MSGVGKLGRLLEQIWANRDKISEGVEVAKNVNDATDVINEIAANDPAFNDWLCRFAVENAAGALGALIGGRLAGPPGAVGGDLLFAWIAEDSGASENICKIKGELSKKYPGRYDEFFPGPNVTVRRNQRITDGYLGSKSFTQRIDPLAFDLDGDGLETVGITATTQILFDHDGDGIRTGTGWLKGDDAFLALDKNGNGTIDNGNELFGVDTVLSNGQKATCGFAALADLDSNHDGQFSSLDAQFANVRLWRDLDQDGISDTGELQTLADAGIASISLSSTATNIPLTGGNVQSAAGTYTRTNGTTGALGEFTTGNTGNLDLAQNPFYREFVDQVPLTAAALDLSDMQGAGAVRDLQEAASLNATVVSDVNNLATLTRTEMLGQIDQLLKDWSATSALKTSQQRAADKGIKLLYKIPGVTDAELEAVQLASTPGYDKTLILSALQVSATRYDVVKVQVDQFSQMMDILERFNGQTFLNFPTDGSIHMGNGTLVQTQIKSLVPTPGGVSTTFSFALPTLTATHVQLLQDSYNALKQSAYDGMRAPRFCISSRQAANDRQWRGAA